MVFQRDKSPFITGRTSIGCQKQKSKTFFSMCVRVIQHPLPSTALNAHGTNCSADGFYARTYINEPYLCYYRYVVCRSRLAEADAETCAFTGPMTQAAGPQFFDFQKIKNRLQYRFIVSCTHLISKLRRPMFWKKYCRARPQPTLHKVGRPNVYHVDRVPET